MPFRSIIRLLPPPISSIEWEKTIGGAVALLRRENLIPSVQFSTAATAKKHNPAAQSVARIIDSELKCVLDSDLINCYFCWNVGRINLAAYNTIGISQLFDEFPLEENADLSDVTGKNGLNPLNIAEQGRVSANQQTYLCLLDGYMKSGSLIDAKKVHGRIFKAGFDKYDVICNRLVDVYVAFDNLDNAIQVFDKLPYRSVSSWKRLISGFVGKKLSGQLLSLFSQMLVENINPDETIYSYILQALSGEKIAFHYVHQIHAKIIRHGFGQRPLVCNPLIDLYSKNGFVNRAKIVFDHLCSKDCVSWVAMISGFSQSGHEEEGILFFCEMHASGTYPTPYIFSSVISACTKIELFKVGEQLHAHVLKWGFSGETFVCNALVTLYSRCANLISAEKIFSQMQRRDEVSYNSLISGLALQGLSEGSLKLFEKMQFDHLKPDCVTVASLLSACASIGALYKGRQLHSYAVKAGMCADIIIEGSLLDLYVKCSDVKTAHNFFLTTQTENVVLWNVMLVAYGQKGDLNESFQIFSQMQMEGLQPNQYTFPNILRTCTLVGALDLGQQIHTQVIKTGFQPNVFVCSVLIDMYAKHGKLDTALGILRRFDKEDVISWTAMIAGYNQHDLFVEALRLFQEMRDQGIQSDNIGFSSAITACAGIQAFDQGRQLHAQSVVSGYSQDLSIGNALVSLYSRCGKAQDAYLAFETIQEKDNISWNGLVSGFSQSGHWEEALQVFSKMNQAGIEVNMFTFGSAVSAAANTANIKQGKQIHAMIIKTGYDTETEASNVLITLYAKCGSLDDAKRVFVEMPIRNEISWNAMITGYSQHGCGNEAIELFEEMKRLGVMPNHVTLVGVLSACSHVGLVDKGLNYFKSMRDEHGIEPKPEHYVCVVDILGRAGLFSRAIKFIDTMPFEPDAMVWRTLLSACTVHKNMDIGELAARHLLGMEPEDSATYVLLSNMYAIAGKWDHRDRTRQLMKDRGVKKEPGRSWIEVKNTVHAFFVGDRLHPLADKIYAYLKDLNERAEAIGYVQDRYSLLTEAEQGQKDPTAYIHSEKLAISFGLISLSNDIPLCVIKNLRVCNDCHNWIKFVSKVSNHTIVVRDAYRFHHFVDGDCSCKDYW